MMIVNRKIVMIAPNRKIVMVAGILVDAKKCYKSKNGVLSITNSFLRKYRTIKSLGFLKRERITL